ncbi:MAG: restriction endonuclease subunit S [Deltaproteobacteria bacterium]|nr:restriction endonuclease subunit S [Deltaproteobacteria bacterium]
MAKKPGEFKPFSIGKIPKDWEVKRLREVFEIVTGTTPSTKNNEFWDPPEINWITPIDLSLQRNQPFIVSSQRRISQKGVRNCCLTVIPENSIILSTRAPVGYVALVKAPTTFNQGCKGLIPRKQVDPLFYVYYFKKQKPLLELISGGSTFKELAKQTLENLWILLPPLPEQRRIAEILRTVDEGIEKVEQEIEHTERLKKALMQRLLTRGIGHKEFKDSPIGKIPKDWKVVRLGEICQLERGRFAHRPRNDPNLYGGDIPFIQTGDIAESNGIIKNYKQTLNAKGLAVSKLFRAGTLVISIAGNIGDVGILGFDACFPDSIIGIKPDEQKAYSSFLLYMLKKFQVQLSFAAPRSTQRNINLKILNHFLVPLPPLSEQKEIVKILLTVDRKLELLHHKKERLQKIKRGLMSDLLTGRKRVKVHHAEV